MHVNADGKLTLSSRFPLVGMWLGAAKSPADYKHRTNRLNLRNLSLQISGSVSPLSSAYWGGQMDGLLGSHTLRGTRGEAANAEG